MTRKTKLIAGLGGGAVVVIAIAVVGGLLYFSSSDAPPPVSGDDVSDVASDGRNPVPVDAIDRTWSTIASAATSGATSAETFVGYRIGENLTPVGQKDTTGRSAGVAGEMTIAGGDVESLHVDVDMTELQSDKSGRDSRLQTQGLETEQFPQATFVLTAPIQIDAATIATEAGQHATAVGDLTLHGVTKSIEVAVEARLHEDAGVASIVGSAPIALADYSIQKPSAPPVLSIDDAGQFEFTLLFAPAR